MTKKGYKPTEEQRKRIRERKRRLYWKAKGIVSPPQKKVAEPIELRIWRKFRVNEKTGCWDWIGCLTPAGYGQIELSKQDGKRRVGHAHRVIFELIHGEQPFDVFICHTCDNPRCVNPYHLFAGSHQDNVDDCRKKGRIPTGSKRPNSRITEADVQMIVDLIRNGKRPFEIAHDLGLSKVMIHGITSGKSWKHVTGGTKVYPVS